MKKGATIYRRIGISPGRTSFRDEHDVPVANSDDTHNGQPVAIKIPHEELESDPVLYERFLRGAEIGMMLDHPGVMKVYQLPLPGARRGSCRQNALSPSSSMYCRPWTTCMAGA
jgi:serine/threonine protein kinase